MGESKGASFGERQVAKSQRAHHSHHCNTRGLWLDGQTTTAMGGPQEDRDGWQQEATRQLEAQITNKLRQISGNKLPKTTKAEDSKEEVTWIKQSS